MPRVAIVRDSPKKITTRAKAKVKAQKIFSSTPVSKGQTTIPPKAKHLTSASQQEQGETHVSRNKEHKIKSSALIGNHKKAGFTHQNEKRAEQNVKQKGIVVYVYDDSEDSADGQDSKDDNDSDSRDDYEPDTEDEEEYRSRSYFW